MSSLRRRAPLPWPAWAAALVGVVAVPRLLQADPPGALGQQTHAREAVAVGAAAAGGPAAARASSSEALAEAAPSASWRFGLASPVSGPPAVGPTGLVYVSSVEGFVHALDARGGLRWSYGLAGTP